MHTYMFYNYIENIYTLLCSYWIHMYLCMMYISKAVYLQIIFYFLRFSFLKTFMDLLVNRSTKYCDKCIGIAFDEFSTQYLFFIVFISINFYCFCNNPFIFCHAYKNMYFLTRILHIMKIPLEEILITLILISNTYCIF